MKAEKWFAKLVKSQQFKNEIKREALWNKSLSVAFITISIVFQPKSEYEALYDTWVWVIWKNMSKVDAMETVDSLRETSDDHLSHDVSPTN